MKPLLTLMLSLLCFPVWGKNLLLTPSHGDGGNAWGKSECSACHPRYRIHQSPAAATIRTIVQDKGETSCMGCHGDNGTGQERPCLLCHNNLDLPHSPLQDGPFVHAFPGRTQNQGCVICHLAADMDGNLELEQDFTSFERHELPFSQSQFCLSCHQRQPAVDPALAPRAKHGRDPSIAMHDNYQHIDRHGLRPGKKGRYSGLRSGWEGRNTVECTACHSMHGTHNPGLIVDRSDKSRLLDAQLDQVYFVEVANGQYAQLCVLCHQMQATLQDAEQDTGNGLSGVHQASGDCRACHQHGQPNQAGM